MRKQFFLSILILVTIVSAFSCRVNVLKGEGNKGTSTPTVQAFNAIDINIPLKTSITVQPGVQPSVTFNGYENILKHIKTSVDKNTLYIKDDLDETWTMDDIDQISANITVPDLNALSLSGAVATSIHGNLTGDQFKLELSGACKVIIDNINVKDFTSEASGAANIAVNGGTVGHVSYEISGAGKITAFPLQADNVEVSISGAGKSEVTALKTLSAGISGAGSIKYKGHPTVTQDVSGAGSISDAN